MEDEVIEMHPQRKSFLVKDQFQMKNSLSHCNKESFNRFWVSRHNHPIRGEPLIGRRRRRQ
jgi:hypothetical protein